MEIIGMIADHPTPKAKLGGGIAYTMNSRDYKAPMLVVVSSYAQAGFGGYAEGVGTVRASGGDYGGVQKP